MELGLPSRAACESYARGLVSCLIAGSADLPLKQPEPGALTLTFSSDQPLQGPPCARSPAGIEPTCGIKSMVCAGPSGWQSVRSPLKHSPEARQSPGELPRARQTPLAAG